MTLLPDWKLILTKAWSVRLIALAGVLTALESALPLFQEVFPPGLFAALSALATAGALIARLVAQPKLQTTGNQDDPSQSNT